MPENLYIGIDLGTSGARVVDIDDNEREIATGKAAIGHDIRSPQAWRSAGETALRQVLVSIEKQNVRSLSVDGTSGTVLAADRSGTPLAPALMYNDPPLNPAAREQ